MNTGRPVPLGRGGITILSFSIHEHIPSLISGAKHQTTRSPRKRPFRIGELLQLYFKPHQKSGCNNCISIDVCAVEFEHRKKANIKNYPPCEEHNNFFGTAKITGILHFSSKLSDPTRQDYSHFVNMKGFDYHLALFKDQTEPFMEQWAQADGFASLEEANLWFGRPTRLWRSLPWDVIIFEGMVKGKSQKR